MNFFEKASYVRTEKWRTRSFICKVNFNILSSSRHVNCDTVFTVLVSLLNESVHGFNNICKGSISTRFQIVEFQQLWMLFVTNMNFPSVTFWYIDGYEFSGIATYHRHSKFSGSTKTFVGELIVLSEKSCADAIETNCLVSGSIVKWFSSTLFEEIYHG